MHRLSALCRCIRARVATHITHTKRKGLRSQYPQLFLVRKLIPIERNLTVGMICVIRSYISI